MIQRVLAFMLVVAAAAPAAAHDRRDEGHLFSRERETRLDTTVAFHTGGLVAVAANESDITIHAGTGNSVTVRASADRGQIRFDAGSDRISVDAGDAGDGRIDVTVPAGVRVTARSNNGDVTVTGTGADVSAHSLSGDLHIENATGHIDFNTLSGEIVASNLKGTVTANSISGDVTLTDVTGNVSLTSVSGGLTLRRITSQAVDAQTTSGDVTFDGTINPAGRYAFATHSGDIALGIPAHASAQLTVSTWSGSIDSDFPITLQPGEHDIGVATSKQFTFTIGGGNARIRAQSFNGDIVIHQRGNQ